MYFSLSLQNGHLCKLHVPLWWVWGATGCICLQWEGWKLKVGQGRRQLRELKVESGCCCSKVKEHWSLSLPVCNISFASSQQDLSFHKKLKRAKMKWVGWGLGKGSEGGGRRQDFGWESRKVAAWGHWWPICSAATLLCICLEIANGAASWLYNFQEVAGCRAPNVEQSREDSSAERQLGRPWQK